MADDRFRVWEFRDGRAEDARIRAEHGVAMAAAAGATDPGAIDFTWHQRNFEDFASALRDNRRPHVDGVEARRAVALIRAIYESAAAGGTRKEVIPDFPDRIPI